MDELISGSGLEDLQHVGGEPIPERVRAEGAGRHAEKPEDRAQDAE